jgi:GNAT superfamily N-acetyltransferase
MIEGEITLTKEGEERIILITDTVYSLLKEAFPDAPIRKKIYDDRDSIFRTDMADKLSFSGNVNIYDTKRVYPLIFSFAVKAMDFEDGECGICCYLSEIAVSEDARGKGYARKILDVFAFLYNERLIGHLNFKDASEGFWTKMLPRYPFLNNIWKNGWVLDVVSVPGRTNL